MGKRCPRALEPSRGIRQVIDLIVLELSKRHYSAIRRLVLLLLLYRPACRPLPEMPMNKTRNTAFARMVLARNIARNHSVGPSLQAKTRSLRSLLTYLCCRATSLVLWARTMGE